MKENEKKLYELQLVIIFSFFNEENASKIITTTEYART